MYVVNGGCCLFIAGLSAGFGGGMAPLQQQLQALHQLRNQASLAGSLPTSNPFLSHSGLMHGSPFGTHQSLYMPSLGHSLNLGKQDIRVSSERSKERKEKNESF